MNKFKDTSHMHISSNLTFARDYTFVTLLKMYLWWCMKRVLVSQERWYYHGQNLHKLKKWNQNLISLIFARAPCHKLETSNEHSSPLINLSTMNKIKVLWTCTYQISLICHVIILLSHSYNCVGGDAWWPGILNLLLTICRELQLLLRMKPISSPWEYDRCALLSWWMLLVTALISIHAGK